MGWRCGGGGGGGGGGGCVSVAMNGHMYILGGQVLLLLRVHVKVGLLPGLVTDQATSSPARACATTATSAAAAGLAA